MKKLRQSPTTTARHGDDPNYVKGSIYPPPNAAGVQSVWRGGSTTASTREQDGLESKFAFVTLLPMKALVISRLGNPDVLEVRQTSEPASAPGQELVRAETGGI